MGTPADRAGLRINMLGGMNVQVDGAPAEPPPVRARGLLAILLLDPQPHPRARLGPLLRPDLEPGRARQRLSSLLHLLRSSLPGLELKADACSVWVPPEGRDLDVEEFTALVAGSEPEQLEAITRVYRGALLPEVGLDWVAWRREALETSYRDTGQRLAEAFHRDGRCHEAVRVLQRLCQSDAATDTAVGMLMQFAAEAGTPETAVTAYRRYTQRHQLSGLEPAGELAELAAELGTADVGAPDGTPTLLPTAGTEQQRDAARRAEALVNGAMAASHAGDGRKALALAGEAALLAADHQLMTARARAHLAEGQEHLRGGRPAQAVVAVSGWLREQLPVELRVDMGIVVARARVALGDLEAATDLVAGAVAAAEGSRRRTAMCESLLTSAFVHRNAGRYQRARAALKQACAHLGGVSDQATAALEQLAIVLDEHPGPPREPLLLWDPAIQRTCADEPSLVGALFVLQAQVHQRHGRHHDARMVYEAARRVHVRRGEPHRAAVAGLLAVESHLAVGQTSMAKTAVTAAEQLRRDRQLPDGLVPLLQRAGELLTSSPAVALAE